MSKAPAVDYALQIIELFAKSNKWLTYENEFIFLP